MRKIRVLTVPRRSGEEPEQIGMLIDPQRDGERPFGLGAGAGLLSQGDPVEKFEYYWAGWSNGYTQTRAVTP